MERMGLMDPDDPIDIFCLHYTAGGLLQRTIDTFVRTRNNHPLRTTGNLSPSQLFKAGLSLIEAGEMPVSQVHFNNFVLYNFNI